MARMRAQSDEAAERARSNEAPEVSAVLERLGAAASLPGAAADPVGLIGALGRSLWKATYDPANLARLARLAGHTARLGTASLTSLARSFGAAVEGPARPGAKDRRFSDAARRDNPFFYALMQAYLLSRQLLLELIEAGADETEAAKARFAAELLADALAPTNFFPTNPAALRRAWETGGLSTFRGWLNFLRDLRDNGGWPSQVDLSAFEVGRNLATSPGQVVYRNELIELIQYAPATDQVREVPLLICPPWINKYYIVDLAPGKSLVEWAVSHGLTAGPSATSFMTWWPTTNTPSPWCARPPSGPARHSTPAWSRSSTSAATR